MKTSFIVNPTSHCLENVRFVESPNQDARPEGMPLDLIVIHGISLPPNQFGGQGVEQLFTNQLNPDDHPYYAEIAQLKVSAHLFVRRDGEVVQFVPFDCRAWHAGVSTFCGRERCNDFSIGIELEGTDDLPYTQAQYVVLDGVVRAILQAYPSIAPSHIQGHSDIAPGRKTDPGEHFDWRVLEKYIGSAKHS